MSAALLRAWQVLPNIQTIVIHYMMESRHSQMECDSVHSTIERVCRKIDVRGGSRIFEKGVRIRRKARRRKGASLSSLGGVWGGAPAANELGAFHVQFYAIPHIFRCIFGSRLKTRDGEKIKVEKVK